MENNDFFTQEEHKQLIQLYKRLLRLSKDTLQKDDCHKLKTHLVKAMAEGTIPRNVFQMNPIIKDMQTAVIVAEEIGMRRASILGIMLHESVKYNLCSLESVKEEYGEDVAGIIRGLVKINELYSKSPIIESENFRNLLLSFAEDMRVILIIIADRVNLMRQIKDSPNEEARLEVSAPAQPWICSLMNPGTTKPPLASMNSEHMPARNCLRGTMRQISFSYIIT